ncbi:hypothetical protein ABFS82_11G063300 [Erythranthe guttata]|uniref:Small ribosomal subunit protein mS38 n=1 Tax=Erythranthe guttata TaxID=4155 RepID=A0A022QSQ5_ERYGU|nr:hypothetical protein MIMGU_mgv1a016150mg [Erythranthe guttata]
MASTMHKLLQKPLQQAISPHLKLHNPLNLLPSLLHRRPNLDPPPEVHHNFNAEKSAVGNGFHVFPSFSLGFFLDPKFSSGLHQIESPPAVAEKSGSDESEEGMWADSVKKKRKKKMNKHKLRKLRKRIRGYA